MGQVMRCSDRPETFSLDDGRLLRWSGTARGEGSGLRRGCTCGAGRATGFGCRGRRFPGGLGRALEAFGVDRIMTQSMAGADLHGIGR
ncbi:MAG: hypothetical protein U1A06_06830 [Hoeflea sp.]|nr:hypothetical protein [Hoeflea sp.]